MAMSNELNKPQLSRDLGDISATTTYGLLHCQKKLIIRGIRAVALAAITGTSTNYLTFQLKILDAAGTSTDLGDSVDSKAGVTAGLFLDLGEDVDFEIEEGETLMLTITKTGTGAWADCLIAMDTEIVGN